MKRTVFLPLLIALALGIGACGVKTGEEVSSSADPSTSATAADDASDPTTAGEGTGAPDQGPEADPDSDTTAGDDATDTTAGDDSTDDTATDDTAPAIGDEMMRDALIQGFVAAGLSTEQATCLADGYLELGLLEPGASPDFTQAMDLFSECGVSMEDLGRIGADFEAGTT